MKILVLSPHRGSAAFSLSLSLIGWLAARHTITVLNAFTRSLEAPYSDADFAHPNDRLSYVSAMRRREDELFLHRLPGAKGSPTPTNIQMVDLNLKDAPLRLRCIRPELYTLAVNPEDPAIEKIRKALAKLIESGQADALVLPLGLGHHVDHLTVLEAALPTAASLPTAFYEDLPDAILPGATTDLEDPEALRTRLLQPLTPVLCNPTTNAIENKRRLVLGYASQVDDQAGDDITSFGNRYGGGTERLWANPAWLALAERSPLSIPVHSI